MVIGTLSHEDLQLGVLRRETLEIVAYLLLAHGGRKVVLAFEDELGRNIRIEVVKT